MSSANDPRRLRAGSFSDAGFFKMRLPLQRFRDWSAPSMA
jgi:hypothetical protein